MPNHASATLIGHLGRDPETRSTAGGTLTFKAVLAVNTGFGANKTTTWWNITAFGKKAEALERFNLTKGIAIGFSGEPSIREYKDKDGNTRFSADLAANDFILLGEKGETSEKPAPKKATSDAPFDDDTIPF